MRRFDLSYFTPVQSKETQQCRLIPDSGPMIYLGMPVLQVIGGSDQGILYECSVNGVEARPNTTVITVIDKEKVSV